MLYMFFSSFLFLLFVMDEKVGRGRKEGWSTWICKYVSPPFSYSFFSYDFSGSIYFPSFLWPSFTYLLILICLPNIFFSYLFCFHAGKNKTINETNMNVAIISFLIRILTLYQICYLLFTYFFISFLNIFSCLFCVHAGRNKTINEKNMNVSIITYLSTY